MSFFFFFFFFSSRRRHTRCGRDWSSDVCSSDLGDVELCERLLRRAFTGEDGWCQLFSVPGAGSDMANLGCRAVRDGDEWVVDGPKVWTTNAHLANRALLLTRTNPDAPKHRGITYFALDLPAPGVEVRPLR